MIADGEGHFSTFCFWRDSSTERLMESQSYALLQSQESDLAPGMQAGPFGSV